METGHTLGDFSSDKSIVSVLSVQNELGLEWIEFESTDQNGELDVGVVTDPLGASKSDRKLEVGWKTVEKSENFS